MKKILLYLLITLFALGFTACRGRNSIAKIGKSDIKKKEYTDLIKSVSMRYPEFVKTKEGRQQVLDSLIREKILEEEAARRKFKEDIEIQRQIKEIIIEKMLNTLKSEDLKVTDAEVKKYYNENSAYYQNPREIQVAHILLATQEKAEEILSEIQTGKDFELLVKNNSIDSYTKEKGGVLDFFGRGDMLPEFEEAAFNLKNKGDVSSVVKSQVGYHLIKFIGERKRDPLKLEDVSYKIREILNIKKFEDWLEGKYKDFNIRVNKKLLNEIKEGNTDDKKTNI